MKPVDSVHSVESGVDIYTLAIDGLYGNNNPLGFPLFNGLFLNIKIDISNTETASKIRISDSDYTFLKENDNTYSTLNAGELIKNNYYKVIYNGSEFILSNTTKATETNSGISKIATQLEVNAGIDNTTVVSPAKLFSVFLGSKAANGYQKFPNGLILQWGYIADQDIQTAYFPISFFIACTGVFVQRVQGFIGTATGTIIASASGSLGATNVFETTKTYFKVDSAYKDPDKSAVFWMAIGY